MHNLIQITVEAHVATYLRHHYGVRMSLFDKNVISTILIKLFEPFFYIRPFSDSQSEKREFR